MSKSDYAQRCARVARVSGLTPVAVGVLVEFPATEACFDLWWFGKELVEVLCGRPQVLRCGVRGVRKGRWCFGFCFLFFGNFRLTALSLSALCFH